MSVSKRYTPEHAGMDVALIGCDFSAILPPGAWIEYPGVDHEQFAPETTSVGSLTLTSNAPYTVIPSVTIDAPATPGGVTATATATLAASSAVTVDNGGSLVGIPTPVGSTLTFPNGIVIQVTGGEQIPGAFLGNLPAWTVTSAVVIAGGTFSGSPGAAPDTTVQAVAQSGSYTIELWPTITVAWQIGSLNLTNGGSGYTATPNVTISPDPASGIAATAVAALAGPVAPGGAMLIPTPRLEIYTNNMGNVLPAAADWSLETALAVPDAELTAAGLSAGPWFWVQSSDGTTASWQVFATGSPPAPALQLGTATRRDRSVFSIVSGGKPGVDYLFVWIVTDNFGNRWSRSVPMLVGPTT